MIKKKRYKIAYITSSDPFDATKNSGVNFYQRKSMQEHIGEIEALGPVHSSSIERLKRIFKRLFRYSSKNYNLLHSVLISKTYGRIFNQKIKNGNFDLLFGDRASTEMAYIKTHIPIIYSTDTTFDAIHDYYPEFSDLACISIFEGNKIERTMLNNASVIICASNWASNSVIQKYQINPQKVFILLRGANLDTIPDKKRMMAATHKTCKLLFVGKDWERKGGDIAYEAFLELKKMGIDVHFTVIGCTPPIDDPDVSIIPYINKNVDQDRNVYEKILRETTFLILPTRAECMGIVLAEASAYGIPSFASHTGGISSAVINGKTGYLLPLSSRGKEYAILLRDLFLDKEKHSEFRQASMEYYQQCLNWDSWARKLKSIIDQRISH